MRSGLLLCSLFSVGSGKVYFSETFGEGWESRWTLSKWKESETEKMGKWVASAGKWFNDEAEDKGLMTSQIMKFYGIAAPFESFSNAGKDLVVQYQAKYEKDLGCGGGYLKVGPKQEDLTAFGDPTPYNIMFGPDQCNADKRTHLIFSYKGKNHLKKDELPYKQEGEGVSHLYRLVLRRDGTVRVEVDQVEVYEGAMKAGWDMLPPAEITDPDDKKPADWVDEATVDDPEDKKPADWVDEKHVVDKEAKKPDEWDDEEDGEWEAPKVANPAFKGAWAATPKPNPAYKGAWEAKKIPNPDFVEDPELHKYSDFGYVGFDVYQVKGGTIFDNVIITDSIEEADEFAKKWKALSDVEQAKKKKGDEAESVDFTKFREARAARAAALKAAAEEKAAAEHKESGGSDAAKEGGAEPDAKAAKEASEPKAKSGKGATEPKKEEL